MKQVLLIQRILPDYRVPFFMELHRLLAARGVRLEVMTGQQWAGESFRDGSGDVPFRLHTRNIKLIGNAYWQKGVLSAAKGRDMVVFEQSNSALHLYPILLRRILGKLPSRLAVWGHGIHMNKEKPQPLRDAWKRLWSTRVDFWFAYTELSANIIQQFGFPVEKITVVQNAIDTQQLRSARQAMSERDLLTEFQSLFGEERRASHRVGVFCARLAPLKKVPFLLNSLAIIHRQYPDFRMVIIGDGDDRGEVEAFCTSHAWCRWVGAIHGEERVSYLALADLFLNPGMTGLSILDAFALGIPFATTDCGIHSPEIAYLNPGYNGVMSAPREDAFAEAVLGLLQSDRLSGIKQNASSDGEKYTIENMARNFADGIIKALA